jgi:hypothetical protein
VSEAGLAIDIMVKSGGEGGWEGDGRGRAERQPAAQNGLIGWWWELDRPEPPLPPPGASQPPPPLHTPL